MESLRSLKSKLAQLRASIPTHPPAVVAIFRSADGKLNPFNLDKLRAARADGAQVITFRFMAPPSEELSS
jgi:hypothetical protein